MDSKFRMSSGQLSAKSLTSSSWLQEQKYTCNTPCKYFKKGMCKLGYTCRFLHVNPKTRRPTADQHELAVTKTICNQICKYGRRPFLHIAVLYASDPRVNLYTEEVVEKFSKHGIDVAVQKYLQESKYSGYKKRDVRTEHLAEIICSSHADFLIVIGDRNMKNKSCQAKRKGKLIEMKVTDMIALIWKSWPQNPHKTLTRIQNMNPAQVETLLYQYCGLRRAVRRLQFLKTTSQELSKANTSHFSTLEEANVKLENLQESSIELHNQLKKSIKLLNRVSVHQEDPDASRGCIMPLDYKPNSSRAPRNSISDSLKYHLQKVLLIMMQEIEEYCRDFGVLPLWEEYYNKHLDRWPEFKAEHIGPKVEEASVPGYFGHQQDGKNDSLLKVQSDKDDADFMGSTGSESPETESELENNEEFIASLIASMEHESINTQSSSSTLFAETYPLQVASETTASAASSISEASTVNPTPLKGLKISTTIVPRKQSISSNSAVGKLPVTTTTTTTQSMNLVSASTTNTAANVLNSGPGLSQSSSLIPTSSSIRSRSHSSPSNPSSMYSNMWGGDLAFWMRGDIFDVEQEEDTEDRYPPYETKVQEYNTTDNNIASRQKLEGTYARSSSLSSNQSQYWGKSNERRPMSLGGNWLAQNKQPWTASIWGNTTTKFEKNMDTNMTPSSSQPRRNSLGLVVGSSLRAQQTTNTHSLFSSPSPLVSLCPLTSMGEGLASDSLAPHRAENRNFSPIVGSPSAATKKITAIGEITPGALLNK